MVKLITRSVQSVSSLPCLTHPHLLAGRASAPQLFSPGGSASSDDPALLRSIGIVLGGVVGLGILAYLVYRYCRPSHAVGPAPLPLGAAVRNAYAADGDANTDPDLKLGAQSAEAALAALQSVLDAHRVALLRPFPPHGVAGA